jgi:hypothetical protein
MIQEKETQKHPYMRCYLLTKVAAMYFHTYTRADVCKRCFIEKIEEDIELYEKLKATGFAVTNKYITPKQMELIIEYWGIPYGM